VRRGANEVTPGEDKRESSKAYRRMPYTSLRNGNPQANGRGAESDTPASAVRCRHAQPEFRVNEE